MRRPRGQTIYEAARWLLKHRTEETADGCLMWTGSFDRHGYPKTSFEDVTWPAHRLIFHAVNGYLHRSEPVHHACGRSGCVHPDHLVRATHAENIAEMHARQGYVETIADLADRVDRLDELIERLLYEIEEGTPVP